jgi:hypothetical protein
LWVTAFVEIQEKWKTNHGATQSITRGRNVMFRNVVGNSTCETKRQTFMMKLVRDL